MLALPHLVDSIPEMRTYYRAVDAERRAQQRTQLRHLVEVGTLDLDDRLVEQVLAQLTLTRFWLAEHRITYPDRTRDEVIAHYLAVVADILAPHATTVAASTLEPYLSGFLAPIGPSAADDRA